MAGDGGCSSGVYLRMLGYNATFFRPLLHLGQYKPYGPTFVLFLFFVFLLHGYLIFWCYWLLCKNFLSCAL